MASNCKCASSFKCECVGCSCTSDVYDVIVVGAGVMGSSTAYQLAKQRKKVLLLEKFPLPHTRGSSHGASRIFRTAYAESYLAKMMPTAIEMWKTLEAESGLKLLRETGLLVFSKSLKSVIEDYASNIVNSSMPGVLKFDELQQHFPMISFDPAETGCYEDGAGTLFADKCLRAFQHVFSNHGGTLLDNEEVVELIPGETVSVRTKHGVHKARGVVLTCGSWSGKLLSTLNLNLPLQSEAIQVCYWRSKDGGSLTDQPCFIFEDVPDIYGLPEYEYPGSMKICLHNGILCDADERDLVNPLEEKQMNSLKEFIIRKFPRLLPEPTIKERCIYTLTPDQQCIIDHHPVHRNIVYATGFSGHGFKLAPVIGLITSEMVQQRVSNLYVKEFEASRFENNSKL